MKFLAGVAAVAASLLVAWAILGAFAFADPTERDYQLEDGRTIHCLVQASVYGASLSCDWANARP